MASVSKDEDGPPISGLPEIGDIRRYEVRKSGK
jgi:hypothetical protein